MKWWQIALIAVGVVALHIGLFWFISDFKPLPNKGPYVPPPNFSAKEAWGVNPETGETIHYQEFRVSTKLALPDVLMEKEATTTPPPLTLDERLLQ